MAAFQSIEKAAGVLDRPGMIDPAGEIPFFSPWPRRQNRTRLVSSYFAVRSGGVRTGGVTRALKRNLYVPSVCALFCVRNPIKTTRP